MTPDEIPEGYIDPKTLTPSQIRVFERQVIAANAIIDQRASMLVDDIEVYRSQLKTLLCDNWDEERPDIVAKMVREDLNDGQLALLCNLGLYAMQSLMVKLQERQMEAFREAAE